MPSPLIKKLHIKPSMRIMVINPPAGYQRVLGKLPEGVTMVSRPRSPVELVQMFCGSIKQLKDSLPQARRSLKHGGIFWICWPKQIAKVDTDLNRDILWRVMLQQKYKPVASIAIDDTWSALRFKPAK